jgi:uncharacterized protein involved in exopolysaccharide biosynthesis
MERPYEESSLRDFLSILFKHKKKILWVFIVIVAGTALFSFLYPPVFEAKSSLLVKFGREFVYRPEVGDKGPLVSLNQEEIINSGIKILTSKDLIEKALNTLTVEHLYPDLAKNPPGRQTVLAAAIHRFQKDFSVEGVKKSNVIEISFQHKDPNVAEEAVRLIINFFREKHLQVYSVPQSSFLEQQRSTYETKLMKSQTLSEAFKQKYRVYSLREQMTLFLNQRSALDTALKTAQHQVHELQDKLLSLKKQMQTVTQQVPLYTETERYRIIDDAKTQLLTLQLKEQEFLLKYKENTPLVAKVRKEIKIVQEFIRKQEEDLKDKVRTGKNIVYEDMERETVRVKADLSAQEAKITTLKNQIAQLDKEIQSLDLRENELRNLERDLEMNERNYKIYLEKVEEARISEDLNRQKIANISVIQAARVSARPVKPKKGLNMMLGVIFGAVSGLGLAFFTELTCQSFSTPESVKRRLHLPVLANFPLQD